nr:hypothetical protein [Halomonas sp.]
MAINTVLSGIPTNLVNFILLIASYQTTGGGQARRDRLIRA